MKENIKIKLKQNYRNISNREAPINMLKLKKIYIEELKNQVFIPKRYNSKENTQDEVNYAENTIEYGIKRTLNYTNDAIKTAIKSEKTGDLTLMKRVERHAKITSKLTQVRRTSNSADNFILKKSIGQPKEYTTYKSQMIAKHVILKQNMDKQKIYRKEYYVKEFRTEFKINHKPLKKRQSIESEELYFTTKCYQKNNQSVIKQEYTNQYQEHNQIKQVNSHQIKDIKTKSPSYIKTRDNTANKVKEQELIQAKMKENYKKGVIKDGNKIKKTTTKAEKFKSLETAIMHKTKSGSFASILGVGAALVVIIVLIIVMISSFLQSSIGFLFSDDSIDYGNGDISIENAMEVMEQELNEKVEEIKSSVDYDKLSIYGMEPNWREILSIYAVLGSNREDLDITSMKEENLAYLRKIFWEVCEIDWDVSTYTVKHVYSKDGETVVEYVEKTKLKITLNKTWLDEMVGKYSLSNKEHEQLMELQKPEYEEMWGKMLKNQ